MKLLLLLVSLSIAQGQVVVSQIYGGGGNAGATFRNDFIELLNRGTEPVSLDGWSAQYGSATGTEWQITPLAGAILPGRYYLVQQAAGAGGTAPLPTPDAIGTLAMSATAGRVALVRSDGTMADTVAYAGLSNTTASLRRGAGCAEGFQTGPPAPRNSATPAVNCAAAPPEDLPATISQIQGNGAASPLGGQRVVTRGIVTGRKSNGFFLQSEQDDSDPQTSEGIFVFTSSTPVALAARGNLVSVVGTVAEFQTLTELIEPVITLVSTGATLPAPVTLTAMNDLERLEGMRVQIEWVVATSPSGGSINEANATATSNGAFFAVSARSPRPYRNPDLDFDRIRVSAGLEVTSGTALKNLQGPLDFQLGAYTIVQDPDVTPLIFGNTRRAEPVIVPGPREWSIVSMNLQRLFDDRNNPSTSDPVLTTAAYASRVARTARVIRDYLGSPDVIGVQEVESLDVLRTLAAAAGNYDAYLSEGNDIGGIDVGFLVKRGRVRVVSVQQVGKDALYNGRDILWDRPPLVLRMEVDGTAMSVVVNHLRSLINADSLQVAEKRAAQIVGLRELLASLGGNVVSIGDYNADQWQLQPALPSGFSNLTDSLPPADNYSYIFDGTTQTLDHVLVSGPARAMLTRVQYARLNADFPLVDRVSDHDFPMAYFSGEPVPLRAIAVTNAATFLSGAIAPGEAVTAFGAFPAASRVTVNGLASTVLFQNAGQLTFTVPGSITGRTAVIAIGSTSVSMPLTDASPGIFGVVGSTLFATGLGNPDQCGVSQRGVPIPVERTTEIQPGIFQIEVSTNRRGLYVVSCFDKTSPATSSQIF